MFPEDFSPAHSYIYIYISLGLQVPPEKVFGVGLEGPVIPSEEVLGGVGYIIYIYIWKRVIIRAVRAHNWGQDMFLRATRPKQNKKA